MTNYQIAQKLSSCLLIFFGSCNIFFGIATVVSLFLWFLGKGEIKNSEIFCYFSAFISSLVLLTLNVICNEYGATIAETMKKMKEKR